MPMGQFRFIGSEAKIGQIRMSRFGQRFSIDESLAQLGRKGGCQLLTELEFQKFAFTDSQLKNWADPFIDIFEIPKDTADALEKKEFLRKRDAALLFYRDIRQGLLDPQSKYLIDHSDGPAAVAAPVKPTEKGAI